MEFRQYQCNMEIQAICGQQWKDLCKELGLKQAGRRDELRMRVIGFLYSQEGRVRINEVAASALLIKILNLLKLPLPGIKPVVVPKDKVADSIKACVCGTMVGSVGLICSRCGNAQHPSCMGKSALMTDFVCPLCQMRMMEPFEQVVEVVLPPNITSSLGLGAAQRQFVYTEEMNKRLLEPGKRRAIQMRSIRLDEEGFTHHWPKECTVLLNGKSLFTYTQPPASSSRRRKDTALAISAIGLGANNAMVMRQKEDDAYVFAIFIVEGLSCDAVFKAMSTANTLSVEAGKSFVLTHTVSSGDVTAEGCTVSLKCPLSRFLPEVPARGVRCQHIQCFDLRAYIVLQERAKSCRWRCPICGMLALNVIVDRYMQAVLKQANADGADSVEFLSDGRFLLMPESDDEEAPPRKRPKPVPLELVDGKVVIHPGTETLDRLAWEDFAGGKASSPAVYATVCYREAAKTRTTDHKPVSAR